MVTIYECAERKGGNKAASHRTSIVIIIVRWLYSTELCQEKCSINFYAGNEPVLMRYIKASGIRFCILFICIIKSECIWRSWLSITSGVLPHFDANLV